MANPPFACGFCLGAASAADGTDISHCRCRMASCACAQADHVPTLELITRMAGYCHMTEAAVLHFHEHQRGQVVILQLSKGFLDI